MIKMGPPIVRKPPYRYHIISLFARFDPCQVLRDLQRSLGESSLAGSADGRQNMIKQCGYSKTPRLHFMGKTYDNILGED